MINEILSITKNISELYKKIHEKDALRLIELSNLKVAKEKETMIFNEIAQLENE
jgi:hypothetical protein